MDRFVPRRRNATLLALALLLANAPTPGARARPPVISDEPAGDPGDGVLRPADQDPYPHFPTTTSGSGTIEQAVPAAQSHTYLLIPLPMAPGSPGVLVFRLVSPDLPTKASFLSCGGRWHRAP